VPGIARALSGLVQTVETPINNIQESVSLSPEQVQHPGSGSKLHAGHSHLVSCLAHSNFVAIQPSKEVTEMLITK